ncbi:hypothetical protein BaRGS_00021705 [Batillaria attramentaria]|uniref:Cap-specific mRNA (nucleoside-2'-O-)-methyltransferase 1 n=1 Tax=Batillaria attramentaria TaxID=370345 RepID=A0ABD0KIM6_9CAEN
MGYTEGTGLGKHGQGRQQIVETSKQRGRRGLGHVVEGFEPADIEWNFEKEQIILDEEVEWIPPSDGTVPSLEEMMQWKVIGPKKRTIDDETTYCNEKVLQNILSSKSVFDILESEEMRRARTRSNPYETIRGAFFLNRAAMKMANMDAVMDFMFTNPHDSQGRPMVGSNELLYFADICAGPGGFSEYVLWRRKGECKGFGMTLKGQNDFKLEDFFAGPSEMFEPHYGVGGLHGDGDIFRPDNQEAFISFVRRNSDGKGVHFVMADGGFSVEGQENIQEILSKQLYLCQFLVAVSVLREGGHFVCKLFDLFTPFSAGLVYLMRLIFDSVCIFKPVTSRPANSERYIVCKGLRANCKPVIDYMDAVNRDLCSCSSTLSETDVNHIVDQDVMLDDAAFFTYIYNSNVKLGKRQILNLRKIQAFAQNVDLYEVRQSEVRRKCLEKWQVPDEVRAAPTRQDPKVVFETLLKKSVVFCWDGRSHGRWRKLEGMRVELPTQTLLEVEFVVELRGEGKGQRRLTTVHVMDALFLCGKDVRHRHFRERQDCLQKFVKALHKETRSDLAKLVMPDAIRLEDATHLFDKLEMMKVKGSANQLRLCFLSHTGNYFHPTGIDLIKTVKEPWSMALSKKAGRKYWFNKRMPNSSTFDCHAECIATFRDSKLSSLRWNWSPGVKVHDSQQHIGDSVPSRDDFVRYIMEKK